MKGFGDLFGQSINEYGEKFVSFLKVFAAFYLLPFLVVGIIFGLMVISFFGVSFLSGFSVANISNMTNPLDFARGSLPAGFWALIAFAIPFFIILILVIMNFTYLGFFEIAFSKKKELSLNEIFEVAKKKFWKFFGLNILLMIFLSALFLLLIIPGIIFMIFWIFAMFILFYENCGILESLSRSHKLVSGRWWTLFGYTFLLIIIGFVVSIMFAFIPFGGLVQGLVIYPIVILFIKNMYLDLKKKK